MKIPPQKDIGASLAGDVADRVPGALLEAVVDHGETILRVAPERVADVCRHLREEPSWRFAYPACISCVDRLPRTPRFEVVYHLRSIVHNFRVALAAEVPDDTLSLPSVTPVWKGANWHEREIFDLYGVRFAGHPDLRRIMMAEDWEGHPYRRDYPLAGRGEA